MTEFFVNDSRFRDSNYLEEVERLNNWNPKLEVENDFRLNILIDLKKRVEILESKLKNENK